MSDISKAAHDLKVLAQRFRPVLDVVDALERIGSLEDAERDAKERTAHAKAEADTAAASLVTVQQQVAEAHKKIQLATTDAEQIVAQATQDADQIRARARTDADRIRQEAEAAKATIQKESEALTVTKTRLAGEVEAKQKELAAITARIAETKASIAKLAG